MLRCYAGPLVEYYNSSLATRRPNNYFEVDLFYVRVKLGLSVLSAVHRMPFQVG